MLDINSFSTFIKEAQESAAHKKAVEMGLEYKGFGYYADPRTGRITHQTVGGNLEKHDMMGSGPVDGSAQADTTKMKPGINQQPPGPQVVPGSGIFKAPEPGTEQHPRGENWNPGPNGDNCVNGQPAPEDLSFDTFVGKTNYYKWTAGPDGTNHTNINQREFARENNNHSYDTFISEEETDMGNPTPSGLGGQTPSEKATQLGLKSNGHGGYYDNSGQIVARTVNGELVFYDQGPGGGAVSDGAGGSDMATSQPSWQDPITGQSITPPAQPESPEEIAAVPDAIPAQPPSGYDQFINKKRDLVYANNKLETEIENRLAEVEAKYSENPVLQSIWTKSNYFIDSAMEGEDPAERVVAGILKDTLVKKADQFAKFIDTVKPRSQAKASQMLTRVLERQARLSGLGADEAIINDQEKDLLGLQKKYMFNADKDLASLAKMRAKIKR